MNIFSAFLTAITAACNAYVSYVSYARETELDKIEDEIQKCAQIVSAGGNDSANAELRILLLGKRKQRKINSISPV